MIGKTVSHYKILEELGRGGMGVVYRAEDTKLGRQAAIKLLPVHLSGDDAAKKRFINEAKTASALDHPNICTIYEIDEIEGGRIIMAMAYYEGETLRDRIEGGRLEIEEAVDIALSAARGLAKAHEGRIVHRDVKPANILVTEDGRIKILDFGLAKLAGGTRLTRDGSTLGTAEYMSPEQVQGGDVDHRTDIWSLGVVLYEMITGRNPFRRDYEQAAMYSIVNDDPDPVSSLREDTPPELATIVERALSKDTAGRYRDMEGMRDDLEILMRRMQTDSTVKLHNELQSMPSIAVLPFVNMSPDPENEYFGNGLAEELINALARIRGLRVVARTSAFRFRGREEDIREIGRILNVGSILEGSVRKSGNKLRITAQLINVDDGYHVWSERYDRELEDIFEIQDEIARAIVDKLEITLSLKPGTPIVKKYTSDLAAYNLYLKGLYHWNRMTPDGWVASKECYEEAVGIDPEFAPAYVGLAIWYQSQAYWGSMHPKEARAQSLENTERALEIDDKFAPAHTLLACNLYLIERNWIESEREFKLALELDPSSSITRVNYALHLLMHDRFEDAAVQPRIAQQYDPLSQIVNTWAAIVSYYTGNVEESIKLLERTIEIDPTSWQPHYHLAWEYLSQSRLEEAAGEAKKAVELSGGASIALMLHSSASYLTGRTGEADELLERLLERGRQVYVPPIFIAWINMSRGRIDETYSWIEKAIEADDPWLNFNRLSPAPIRARGKRIEALLKNAGWK